MYICNPSYLGGQGRKIINLKPDWATVRCLNSKKKKKELSYIVDDSYKNYVE
jgi:hypothetical protein